MTNQTRNQIFEVAKNFINEKAQATSIENRIADKLMDVMDLIETGCGDSAKDKFNSIIKYLDLSQRTLIRSNDINFCKNALIQLNKITL